MVRRTSQIDLFTQSFLRLIARLFLLLNKSYCQGVSVCLICSFNERHLLVFPWSHFWLSQRCKNDIDNCHLRYVQHTLLYRGHAPNNESSHSKYHLCGIVKLWPKSVIDTVGEIFKQALQFETIGLPAIPGANIIYSPFCKWRDSPKLGSVAHA